MFVRRIEHVVDAFDAFDGFDAFVLPGQPLADAMSFFMARPFGANKSGNFSADCSIARNFMAM